MAVSPGYLEKVRRSIRVGQNAEVDAEITDLIEECRQDLQSVGVHAEEADSLVLGAIRCYVRWKFGINNDEAERNQNDYVTMKEDLRKKRGYRCTLASGSS